MDRQFYERDFKEAYSLYRQKKYEKASEIFLKTVEGPKNIAAVSNYFLANIANIAGDPRTAQNLYYKAFETDSRVAANFLGKEHPNANFVYTGRKKEEKLEHCPLCKSSKDSTPKWCYCILEMASAHGMAHNPVRVWMYCENCHHVYAEEFPFQDNVTDANTAGGARVTKPQMFSVYSDILNNLGSYSSGNEFLEIGIGASECSCAAVEMGYNVLGLDIVQPNVDQALSYGINAITQDFVEFETDKKWDIIVMGDVIEHVSDPVIAIKKVAELLNDGGVFWISTPNFGSAWGMVDGHNDVMRREVNHKNYFSRESLIRLLGEFGLKPIEYRISKQYRGSMEIVSIKDSVV
ncbi:MAG: class I SAM-dependent methyltransferase [Defluviitaleaceae bacterium]|nr:class I SAM-dependent methyltransferase [Defluviitaleaceae bacterium]